MLSFEEPVSTTITEEPELEEEGPQSIASSPATSLVKLVSSGASSAQRKVPSGTSASNNGTSTPRSSMSSSRPTKAEGIVLSREQILRSQAGILIFQIVSGSLSRRARVEISINQGYWPAYTTEMARSNHANFDEIGEAFIGEQEVATISIKLNSVSSPSLFQTL